MLDYYVESEMACLRKNAFTDLPAPHKDLLHIKSEMLSSTFEVVVLLLPPALCGLGRPRAFGMWRSGMICAT